MLPQRKSFPESTDCELQRASLSDLLVALAVTLDMCVDTDVTVIVWMLCTSSEASPVFSDFTVLSIGVILKVSVTVVVSEPF